MSYENEARCDEQLTVQIFCAFKLLPFCSLAYSHQAKVHICRNQPAPTSTVFNILIVLSDQATTSRCIVRVQHCCFRTCFAVLLLSRYRYPSTVGAFRVPQFGNHRRKFYDFWSYGCGFNEYWNTAAFINYKSHCSTRTLLAPR